METYEEAQQIGICDASTDALKLIGNNKKPLKSMKMIENMLGTLGLSKNEAQVYLHLALSRERKAGEISEALNLHRTNTYRILRDLEKKGLVAYTLEKPVKFIATPFDKAIDVLIETKKLKIQRLERKKKSLINAWISLPKPTIEEQQREVFQIVDGEEQIYMKANEAVQNAQQEIKIFASEEDLARFYNSGFTETLEKLSKKSLSINFLTDNSPRSRLFVEKIRLCNKLYASVESDALPSFILIDQKQLVFTIRSTGEENSRKMARSRISALWTNYESFIKAFSILFSELWSSAIE